MQWKQNFDDSFRRSEITLYIFLNVINHYKNLTLKNLILILETSRSSQKNQIFNGRKQKVEEAFQPFEEKVGEKNQRFDKKIGGLDSQNRIDDSRLPTNGNWSLRFRRFCQISLGLWRFNRIESRSDQETRKFDQIVERCHPHRFWR